MERIKQTSTPEHSVLRQPRRDYDRHDLAQRPPYDSNHFTVTLHIDGPRKWPQTSPPPTHSGGKDLR